MSKKTVDSFIWLGIIALLLGGVSEIAIATEAQHTLTIGLNDRGGELDPAIALENIVIAVIFQLYDGLVKFQEHDYTIPVPALAESWELTEDGKTWIFHLRKGVMFASGNPVNADAVVFSLRRTIKLGTDAGTAWVLNQLGITEESITKLDNLTIQIVLDQQYASSLFLACLTTSVARILDPTVVMAHEANGDMGSAWLNTHSAGSGQFIIEERVPGERTVLRANPRYWGEQPSFDRIIMKHIPEPLTQMALLEKGEIDLAWDLQPEQLTRLRGTPGIQIFQSYMLGIRHLMMNLAYEPLGHPQVREAIRYAIDYDGIVEHVLGGSAATSQTLIPKGVLGYNPALPYTHDIEKAKRLLAEAGYPDGFKTELLCFNSSPWTDVAMKVKADLAQIGIELQVKPLPFSEVIQAIVARDFQMYHGGWTLDFIDPNAIIRPFAHADSDGDDATVKSAAWMSHYVKPELVSLVEQAEQELDIDKRGDLYKQITDIILQDGPYAVLFSPLRQYGVRSEVIDRVGAPPPYTGFPTIR